MTDEGFSRTSKDNFHLLLSELDEEGVIKYALLPFLKDYIKKIDLTTKNTHKIIDYYINLKTVYESFYSIINTDDLMRQMDSFSEKFKEYNPREKEENISTEESQQKSEKAREKLAINDILPFLSRYKDNVKSKITELETYLAEQNQSDSDIISLI